MTPTNTKYMMLKLLMKEDDIPELEMISGVCPYY